MNFRLVLDLYKNRRFGDNRALKLSTLVKYYAKLKIGEITGHIYKNPQNSLSIDIPHATEAMEVIEQSIRNTLNKIKLGNIVDVSQKKGLENIGIGCVLTPAMFGNLIALSQSETSFYFSTNDARKYTLKMDLLAIASISGHIKFEKEVIDSFSIPTLTEHQISLAIKPELVTNEISKVTITVDKCWSPHYLDKDLPDFPLGVGIKSIELDGSH